MPKPKPADDPPVLLFRSEPTALESAKRRLSKIIDGELDELNAGDAMDLLLWLEADTTCRRIEMEA